MARLIQRGVALIGGLTVGQAGESGGLLNDEARTGLRGNGIRLVWQPSEGAEPVVGL